ncbi:unnamed protein product [Pleuronectes platessa]|uniref:Receptor activity-modifying protein 1 n=1 Tax=Pleuronectes platessa TaxID=8262 RepID=A0A9N7U9K3_PLEPL|nr:unnamed protein product [Pleuronectes platessa]
MNQQQQDKRIGCQAAERPGTRGHRGRSGGGQPNSSAVVVEAAFPESAARAGAGSMERWIHRGVSRAVELVELVLVRSMAPEHGTLLTAGGLLLLLAERINVSCSVDVKNLKAVSPGQIVHQPTDRGQGTRLFSSGVYQTSAHSVGSSPVNTTGPESALCSPWCFLWDARLPPCSQADYTSEVNKQDQGIELLVVPSASGCNRGFYERMINDFCFTKFELDMGGVERGLWCSWPDTTEGLNRPLARSAPGYAHKHMQRPSGDTTPPTVVQSEAERRCHVGMRPPPFPPPATEPLYLAVLISGNSTPGLGEGTSPRMYEALTNCSYQVALRMDCYWPNQVVDRFFVRVHQIYFQDCALTGRLLHDPPVAILGPFIAVPVLVTLLMTALVVWRSKRTEGVL